VIATPANTIPGVVKDAIKAGCRHGVIISAGFAEAGEEGMKLLEETRKIATENDFRIIGPNCASFSLFHFFFPRSRVMKLAYDLGPFMSHHYVL